jgi:hypothetical protein
MKMHKTAFNEYKQTHVIYNKTCLKRNLHYAKTYPFPKMYLFPEMKSENWLKLSPMKGNGLT